MSLRRQRLFPFETYRLIVKASYRGGAETHVNSDTRTHIRDLCFVCMCAVWIWAVCLFAGRSCTSESVGLLSHVAVGLFRRAEVCVVCARVGRFRRPVDQRRNPPATSAGIRCELQMFPFPVSASANVSPYLTSPANGPGQCCVVGYAGSLSAPFVPTRDGARMQLCSSVKSSYCVLLLDEKFCSE